MARTTRQVRFEFQGDISDLRKTLDKIPGATKKAVDDSIKQLQKQVEFEGLRKELKELPGVTRAAASKMARELQKVPKAAKTRFAGLGDLIKAELGADVIREGASAIKDYVVELQEGRLETIKFANATGIGLDTLGGLELGVKRAGGNFDQVRDSLADFGERMFDVAQGSGQAKEAFELLDIEVRDLETGALRPVDDVLREVLDKLPRVADEAKRNAIGQQLMSDASLDVVAALQKQDLPGYIADARELNLVLDEDLVQSTKNWAAANQIVEESLLELTAGAGFLPSIGDILLALAVTFDFWSAVAVGSINEVIRQYGSLAEAVMDLARGDVQGALDAAADGLLNFDRAFNIVDQAAEDAADRIRKVRDALQQSGIETKKVGDLEDERKKRGKKASKEAADAAKKEAKAAKEALRLLMERRNALETLKGIRAAATDDLLDDEDRIQAAFEERLDSIFDVTAARGADAQTSQALAEAEARRVRDLANLRIEQEERVADIIRQLDDEIAAARQENFDNFARAASLIGGTVLNSFADLAEAALNRLSQAIAETQAIIDEQQAELEMTRSESEEQISQLRGEIKEARKEGDRERADALRRTIESINEETAAREKQIAGEIEAQKEQKAFQVQLALDAFKQQKQLKKAQAAFSAAVLAIEIATALAATGVGAIAAVPTGVAIAGGALAAQLQLINSQEPPSFHVGGIVGRQGGGRSPDEVPITAQTDEGIVNRRGMRRLGRDGLNAINGGGGGGGMPPMQLVVQILLDRRIVQEEVLRVDGRRAVSLGIGQRAFRRSAYQGQGV